MSDTQNPSTPAQPTSLIDQVTKALQERLKGTQVESKANENGTHTINITTHLNAAITQTVPVEMDADLIANAIMTQHRLTSNQHAVVPMTNVTRQQIGQMVSPQPVANEQYIPATNVGIDKGVTINAKPVPQTPPQPAPMSGNAAAVTTQISPDSIKPGEKNDVKGATTTGVKNL